MNVERRSALGLSVAALMGGMISTTATLHHNVDADLIHLCNKLRAVGSALKEQYLIEPQTAEQSDIYDSELDRLYNAEDQLATAILQAPLPRTFDGFSAIASAAISVCPTDIRGEIVMEHCTTLKLAELVLRTLADRRLAA